MTSDSLLFPIPKHRPAFPLQQWLFAARSSNMRAPPNGGNDAGGQLYTKCVPAHHANRPGNVG